MDYKGPILSVRAFVENEEGRILLLKRGADYHSPHKWSLPGGIANYNEKPEESIISLVKQKTNLDLGDITFLYHQNSPPELPGHIHCLNLYYRGKGKGDVAIPPGRAKQFEWVTPDEAKNFDLAFGGVEAIDVYKRSNIPDLEKKLLLFNEAGEAGIPVTDEILEKLHVNPGFFMQLRDDLRVYEEVRAKINGSLVRIGEHYQRDGESIIAKIESRVKTPDSLMKKMIRKGEPGTPRHYTTFNDVAGARAVVSFLSDAYTLLHDFEKNDSYNIREVEDYIQKPSPEGYRGINVALEVKLKNVPFLPRCELQLQTGLQQAWARASHNLSYKKEGSKKGNHISDDHKKMLIELSEKSAEADRLYEEIRMHVEGERNQH